MLNYFALFLIIFTAVVLFYGIIAIHDIPYDIARHRDHPHQDAIHVAGWVSLFTLHLIWPFLWIWATLYKPDIGWGMMPSEHQQDKATRKLDKQLKKLKRRIAVLEQAKQET